MYYFKLLSVFFEFSTMGRLLTNLASTFPNPITNYPEYLRSFIIISLLKTNFSKA